MIDTISKYRRDRLRMLLHRGIEANYENSKLVLSPRMPFGWIKTYKENFVHNKSKSGNAYW